MPHRHLPRNSRIRIVAAALLQLASFELSRWAVIVLREGSPERVYGDASLSKRRDQFEQLWQARFNEPTPNVAYLASICTFIMFWFVAALATALVIDVSMRMAGLR